MTAERPDLRLRELRHEDAIRFSAAVSEFTAVDPGWAFALGDGEASDFHDYVDRLSAATRGERLPTGFVPHTFLVGVVGDAIVGRLSLRHELNDFLATRGGHVGYGVVPSHRRQGYATAMLAKSLPWARAVGLERLLVTCDEGNVGSRKVIERNGGRLERVVPADDVNPPLRRYWIDLEDVPERLPDD